MKTHNLKIITLILLIIVFAFITLITCANLHKKETITIFYRKGVVETPITRQCYIFKELCNSEKSSDTVFVTDKEFLLIKKGIENRRIMKEKVECDTRLFLKMDFIEICFGEMGCISNCEGKRIQLDSKIEYLIKSESGYYNYFEKENLISDKEIRTFGIPTSYKYQENEINRHEKYIKAIITTK